MEKLLELLGVTSPQAIDAAGVIFHWALFVLLVIIILWLAANSIVITKQNHARMIERWGRCRRIIIADREGRKIEFINPIFDRKSRAVFLGYRQISLFEKKEMVEFKNSSVPIGVWLSFKIDNVEAFFFASSDPVSYLKEMMRAIVGDFLGAFDLAKVNKNKAMVNLGSVLLEKEIKITDPDYDQYRQHPTFQIFLAWGIEVLGVGLSDVVISQKELDTMNKLYLVTMDKEIAEKEKVARVIRAETEKEEKIIRAEGEKEAMVKKGEATAIARGEYLRTEGSAQIEVWQKQINFLSGSLPAAQVVDLLKNYNKWANIPDDLIMIDNSGDSEASRGAGWATGREAIQKRMNKNRKNSSTNKGGD